MSKTNLCLAILALSIAISFAATAHAEKRVALLIGNNAYQNIPRLQTAVNDARAVGTALRGLGFSVILAENQSRRAMSEALLAFDKAIEPGDIALFSSLDTASRSAARTTCCRRTSRRFAKDRKN